MRGSRSGWQRLKQRSEEVIKIWTKSNILIEKELKDRSSQIKNKEISWKSTIFLLFPRH